jgi:parallel beta helix pectate lyase-like protein
MRRMLLLTLTIAGILAFATSASAASYSVNSLADVQDADFPGPFDGVCEAPTAGTCTLRAAVDESNAVVAPDAITLSAPGIITLSLGVLVVQDQTTITGNGGGSTLNGPGAGRVLSIGATSTLNDLRVQNGVTTDSNGAGIFSTAPSLTLNHVEVAGNTLASTGGAAGAGIATGGGAGLVLNDSTVSGNTITGVSGLGGGIRADGDLLVNRSTISGNSTTLDAGGRGGGIDVNITGPAADVTINNSTISGNHAGGLGGGGIFVTNSASMSLVGSTIAGNSTTGFGGGVVAFGTSGAENTIFAENTSVTPGGDNCNVSFAAAQNNIDTGESCLLGTINGNMSQVTSDQLKLGPLQANGGPTATRELLPGSVALDAANPTCGGFATDQRGISRPQGTTCDIGAFEREVPLVTPPPTSTPTPQPAPKKKCKKGKKLKKGKCVKKKRKKK